MRRIALNHAGESNPCARWFVRVPNMVIRKRYDYGIIAIGVTICSVF